jgi:hypothetical protein
MLSACAAHDETSDDAGSASVSIDRTHATATLDGTFAGLSYEKSMVSTAYFSSANTDLVALLARLGTTGIIRIAGNGVDSTIWNHVGAGHISGMVGPPDIDQLAGFLNATGWQAIYGLNFARSNAPAEAAEASYAQGALGNRLYGFSIGNEPNDYAHNGDEPTQFTYADFQTGWEGFADAVATSVPGTLMTGPDESGFNGETTYTLPFAAAEPTRIGLLTQHYYVGSGTDPASTIAKMLTPDPLLPGNLAKLQTAASALGGFRITEANTYSSGGIAGVSNTFASALWAIDFMFTVAQNGGHGVNFHGGKNVYSPIAIGANDVVTGVQPLYYGILLFGLAAHGSLYPTQVSGAASGLNAYAVDESDGSIAIIVVNSGANAIALSIDCGRAVGVAGVLALTAPALDSTSGVELGGAAVAIDGTWVPTEHSATASGSVVTLTLAPTSAALVRAQ